MGSGSTEIVFRPGTVRGGEYRFAVGTAGSTGLVLQTVLMPLVLAATPSRLVLDGGTNNTQAPPFDFIARTFPPIVNRLGPYVAARLVRHGFDLGGGRIKVNIDSTPLTPIDCLDRGHLLGTSATALIAGLSVDVAAREIACARRLIGWPVPSLAVRELPNDRGPGNILLLEAEHEYIIEVVSGFGRLGVPAKRLAQRAVGRTTGYLDSTAFAGPYPAHQLLLPFALAGRGGGARTTVKPSQHARTAADIVEPFTGRRLRFRSSTQWGSSDAGWQPV